MERSFVVFQQEKVLIFHMLAMHANGAISECCHENRISRISSKKNIGLESLIPSLVTNVYRSSSVVTNHV